MSPPRVSGSSDVAGGWEEEGRSQSPPMRAVQARVTASGGPAGGGS